LFDELHWYLRHGVTNWHVAVPNILLYDIFTGRGMSWIQTTKVFKSQQLHIAEESRSAQRSKRLCKTQLKEEIFTMCLMEIGLPRGLSLKNLCISSRSKWIKMWFVEQQCTKKFSNVRFIEIAVIVMSKTATVILFKFLVVVPLFEWC